MPTENHGFTMIFRRQGTTGPFRADRMLLLLLLLGLVACGPPRPSVAQLRQQIQQNEAQILELGDTLPVVEERQNWLRRLRAQVAIDDSYHADKTRIGREVERVVRACGPALQSVECDRDTLVVRVQVAPAQAESLARKLGVSGQKGLLEGRLPERGTGPDVRPATQSASVREPARPAPARSEYERLSEQLDQSRLKLESSRKAIKNLPLTTQQVEEEEKLLKSRLKKLCGKTELTFEDPELLPKHVQAELTAAARKRGVKITRFVPGGGMRVPWNSPVKSDLDGFHAVDFSLNVTGRPAEVAAFLRDIEEGRAKRYDVLTHVKLTPGGARVDLVALLLL